MQELFFAVPEVPIVDSSLFEVGIGAFELDSKVLLRFEWGNHFNGTVWLLNIKP